MIKCLSQFFCENIHDTSYIFDKAVWTCNKQNVYTNNFGNNAGRNARLLLYYLIYDNFVHMNFMYL